MESVSTSNAPDEQLSPTLSASVPDKRDTSTDQASTSTTTSTNGQNNPGNTSTNEQHYEQNTDSALVEMQLAFFA